MRNLLTGVLFDAVESTTAAETIEPIVTQYSDVKIPALTIVLIVVSLVLIIAAAVLGFLYINKHTEAYGFSLITGATAYLLFCYVGVMLVNLAFEYITPIKEYITANPTMGTVFILIASVILGCLAIYFGLRYVFKANTQRHLNINITMPLTMGFSFFLASVLFESYLGSAFELAMALIQINSMGFDQAITTMVQSGANQEEAINALLELSKLNGWDFVIASAIPAILKGIMWTCTITLVYGVRIEKLEENRTLIAFLFVLAYYVPSILVTIFEIPSVIALVVYVVAVGACVFFTQKDLKEHMQDDIKYLKNPPEKKKSHFGGFGGPGKQQGTQKMPKIVMPD